MTTLTTELDDVTLARVSHAAAERGIPVEAYVAVVARESVSAMDPDVRRSFDKIVERYSDVFHRLAR
ncbi:hypothetical protein AYO38_10225 [bacterium SCGC AG-212-C10]|nr:hypothetical protein AYO38_10225 [bacterium SCGC AG-212-C10]